MATKQEIVEQINIFKNAKGPLVQDSLIKVLEMLCDSIVEEETEESNEESQ